MYRGEPNQEQRTKDEPMDSIDSDHFRPIDLLTADYIFNFTNYFLSVQIKKDLVNEMGKK